MNVTWTIEALNDIDEIEMFISEDNPDRAMTCVDELVDFCESLECTKFIVSIK